MAIKNLMLVVSVLTTIVALGNLSVISAQNEDSSICGKNIIDHTITVGQYGFFRSVQAAINSIKSNNDRWIRIYIESGVYIEKVNIPLDKPCIILQGRHRDSTIISFGEHGKINETATFTSLPSNVIASDITFENTYNIERKPYWWPWWWPWRNDNKMEQAVAVSIYGDKSFFLRCNFISVQDTLYDVIGRHYFKQCYIEGEVDFIFGAGQSYYEDCNIHAVGKDKNNPGFVTAQGREFPEDPNGFVFKGGRLYGEGKVNLGRAWKNSSRVIFQETTLSDVVTPEGWNIWNAKREEDITYAEIDCKGEGADASQRVPWMKTLDDSQLQNFTKESFINKDKWLDNLPPLDV